MDILEYNRTAWDKEVERGNKWTVPVDSDTIEAARTGSWRIVLTPTKPVPREWFPDSLTAANVLCLASGGGQQGPILAAAGAKVTVFDNSPNQLAQDRMVAERDSLGITTVLGDMADLSVFRDASFDFIVHPVSNAFVPDVRPVWLEAFRVLRPGGNLIAGFANPAQYVFENPWEEPDAKDAGRGLRVVYVLPYDERSTISADKRQVYIDGQEPLMFGHTLESQLGGQLDAGFVLTGFFEDSNPNQYLSRFMDTYIATRAHKPRG